MRVRILAVFLLIAAMVAAQPATSAKAPQKHAALPKDAPAPAEDSVDAASLRLYRASYTAAASLDAEARVILLQELCPAAENIKPDGPNWCHELFQLAKDQLSAGDLRQHSQAVATMSTAITDPDTALSMLKDIDIDGTTNDERSTAARIVFQQYLRVHSIKGIPDLLSTAAALGDSGLYPYFATSTLLYGGGATKNYQEGSRQDYNEAQIDRCNDVLQQGLTYFKKSSLDLRSDFAFMTLLRAGATSGCPAGYLVHQAATDFADELLRIANAVQQGDEKIKPQAARNLYDSGQRMLESVDPVLARSVEKKAGSIRDLDAQSSPAPPETSNSWISDPDASAINQKIDQCGDVLNNAPVNVTMHTPEVASAIRDGIANSQKLVSRVQEVDPSEAAALRRVSGIIATFMDSAMRVWPSATRSEIENLPDGELKAHMLLFAGTRIATARERDHMLRLAK